MELVLASTNIHKIRELRSLLRSLPKLELLSLFDFPGYEPPEETGITFQENAELKARAAAIFCQKWALADDSGLVVPALQGLPGVHSSSYAGEGATDLENYAKLLSAMAHLQEGDRSAYFSCVISIAAPDGTLKSFHGSCEGMILEEARGRNGFSYDAVFRKHEYNKTFAELDEAVKGRISHRRKALDKALLFLESIKEQHALLD